MLYLRPGQAARRVGQLREIKVVDVSPDMTKWKRLFNALAGAQNQHKVGNHLIIFANRAMNPIVGQMPARPPVNLKQTAHFTVDKSRQITTKRLLSLPSVSWPQPLIDLRDMATRNTISKTGVTVCASGLVCHLSCIYAKAKAHACPLANFGAALHGRRGDSI